MTHRKGKRLTFEDKRRIAKLIVAGWAPKCIEMRENVCQAAISHIRRDFVVTTLTEKYPEDPQLKLDVDTPQKRTYKRDILTAGERT